VDDHFDAEQIIVHRGETINAKTQAALVELNEKLMPGVLTQQIAAERADEQREEEQAELAQQQQQQAQTDAQHVRAQAATMQQQAQLAQSQAREIRLRDEWLAAACVGISVAALSILWLSLRQRRSAGGLAAAMVPATFPRTSAGQTVVSAEFAPHLAQAVKEALVRELAAQRRELLSAQQIANAEIAELTRRLDQLQTPLQERLRAYETQIQLLEKTLAARTEENRELLKMKIEMMRKQIEAERCRVDFN
jgi:DNA anti-recombination protein RmuC